MAKCCTLKWPGVQPSVFLTLRLWKYLPLAALMLTFSAVYMTSFHFQRLKSRPYLRPWREGVAARAGASFSSPLSPIEFWDRLVEERDDINSYNNPQKRIIWIHLGRLPSSWDYHRIIFLELVKSNSIKGGLTSAFSAMIKNSKHQPATLPLSCLSCFSQGWKTRNIIITNGAIHAGGFHTTRMLLWAECPPMKSN